MRPHREPGIRRDASGWIRAYVRANGQLRYKRFPVGTPLETVRRWRLDTRASVEFNHRPAGTLASDIEPYPPQIADRPQLVAERRQQLEWWASRRGHLRRDAIAPANVRAALAALRRPARPRRANHYRQTLFSLYRALDGRDAPNPVRAVTPFTSPPPKARGLSYDVVQSMLTAVSDPGSARVKGKPRAAASAAKARCRVLAFGVSVDFLCGPTTDATPARQLPKELADSTTRVRDLEEQEARVATADDGGDYVGLSELAGTAGRGAVVHHERITGRVKFRREWLSRHVPRLQPAVLPVCECLRVPCGQASDHRVSSHSLLYSVR